MTTLPELLAQMRAVDAGHWADAVEDALALNKPVALVPQWALDQTRTEGFCMGGSIHCAFYDSIRIFAGPQVPIYLAPPEPLDSVSIHGHTIVGWFKEGADFVHATAHDFPEDMLDLGYAPVIALPPSTTFALPEV